MDSPRSRSSWKLEDREELQALNSRFEPAEATHSFSTSYCFSEETIEHVAHRTLCTLLRNWGGGGSGVALKKSEISLRSLSLCVFSTSHQWRTISPTRHVSD